MGLAGSTSSCNDEMIDNLVRDKAIKSKSVETAFRMVDRGNFLHPQERTRSGYNDSAYRENYDDPVGYFHLSAPSIYAMIAENLDLHEGLSFLNLGSGTGYFSSIVGFLIGDSGVNHGVELYEHLVHFAERRVVQISRGPAACAFGWAPPQYLCGNVLQLRALRRYDRIYCGALVPQTRRSFFCDLLSVGGVLIMPYGDNLLRIERQSETFFTLRNVSTVTFGALIHPNVENPVTNRPVRIAGRTPPTLEEVCRNSVRAHLRRVVAAEQDGAPEIRSLIDRRTDGYEDEDEDELETTDRRNEYRGRRRSRHLYRVQRGNSVLFANFGERRHVSRRAGNTNGAQPSRSDDLESRRPADSTSRRPEPAAAVRADANGRLQRVEVVVGMLHDRMARHRDAQANPHGQAVNDPRGVSQFPLLDAQRRREEKKGAERQLLDNDEFELVRGFRFGRRIGHTIAEDVADGYYNSDEDSHYNQQHHRIHGFMGFSSSDSADNEDRSDGNRGGNNDEDNVTNGREDRDEDTGDITERRRNLNRMSGAVDRLASQHRDRDNLAREIRSNRLGDADTNRPVRHIRRHLFIPGIFAPGYSRYVAGDTAEAAEISRNEQQTPPTTNFEVTPNMEQCSSSSCSSAEMGAFVRGGKRVGESSDSGSNKRVRSDAEETNNSDPDIETLRREAENDTSKILQDGIGHALDEVMDESENGAENEEERDVAGLSGANESDETKTSTPALEKAKLMEEEEKDIKVEGEPFKNETIQLELEKEKNLPNNLTRAIDSDKVEFGSGSAELGSSSETKLNSSSEAAGLGSTIKNDVGSSSKTDSSNQASTIHNINEELAEDANEPEAAIIEGEGNVRGRIRVDHAPSTSTAFTSYGAHHEEHLDGDTNEADAEDEARRCQAAFERQHDSLIDFQRRFLARIAALPITSHMIAYLQYE